VVVLEAGVFGSEVFEAKVARSWYIYKLVYLKAGERPAGIFKVGERPAGVSGRWVLVVKCIG